MESKAATQVNACFPDGSWGEHAGLDGGVERVRAASTGSLGVAAFASACAPPMSTPPARAVPAAPVAVPLRKLRRLRSTGFRLLGCGRLPGRPVVLRKVKGLVRWRDFE